MEVAFELLSDDGCAVARTGSSFFRDHFDTRPPDPYTHAPRQASKHYYKTSTHPLSSSRAAVSSRHVFLATRLLPCFCICFSPHLRSRHSALLASFFLPPLPYR